MRRLTAGLATFGMLWVLAGCADPAREAARPIGVQPATATTAAARPGAARPGAAVKQRDTHLSGRQLNLAVYYPRTFRAGATWPPSGTRSPTPGRWPWPR